MSHNLRLEDCHMTQDSNNNKTKLSSPTWSLHLEWDCTVLTWQVECSRIIVLVVMFGMWEVTVVTVSLCLSHSFSSGQQGVSEPHISGQTSSEGYHLTNYHTWILWLMSKCFLITRLAMMDPGQQFPSPVPWQFVVACWYLARLTILPQTNDSSDRISVSPSGRWQRCQVKLSMLRMTVTNKVSGLTECPSNVSPGLQPDAIIVNHVTGPNGQ